MDEGLTAAGDAVAACERVFRMPIPLSYTRHTSRVLMISLAFLPAVLWRPCGWSALPASVLIAFLLVKLFRVDLAQARGEA